MKIPLIFFSTCALIERQSALQSVKRAGTGPDPRVSAAIQGGLLGAGGGALVQVLRRMLQSKQEEEEEGSPSILKGMLMGGLGGAGLGAGAAHLLQDRGSPGISPFAEPGGDAGVPGRPTADLVSRDRAQVPGPVQMARRMIGSADVDPLDASDPNLGRRSFSLGTTPSQLSALSPTM